MTGVLSELVELPRRCAAEDERVCAYLEQHEWRATDAGAARNRRGRSLENASIAFVTGGREHHLAPVPFSELAIAAAMRIARGSRVAPHVSDDGAPPSAEPSQRLSPAETRDRSDAELTEAADALAAAVRNELPSSVEVDRLELREIHRHGAVDSSGLGARFYEHGFLEVNLDGGLVDSPARVRITRTLGGLDDMDPAGVAHELWCTSAGYSGTELGALEAREVVLLPAAAAALLRACTAGVMRSPLRREGSESLAAAVCDDPWARNAYHSRSFDHEGCGTRPLELVSRSGSQAPLRSRLSSCPDAATAGPCTGHARRLEWQVYPQVAPSNVYLSPAAGRRESAGALLQQASVLVVDVQAAGVQHLRAGDSVALRLLCVASSGTEPNGRYEPLTIEGRPTEMLSALRAVSDVVSFYDGDFSAGGAYASMDLSGLA